MSQTEAGTTGHKVTLPCGPPATLTRSHLDYKADQKPDQFHSGFPASPSPGANSTQRLPERLCLDLLQFHHDTKWNGIKLIRPGSASKCFFFVATVAMKNFTGLQETYTTQGEIQSLPLIFQFKMLPHPAGLFCNEN